MTVDNRKKNERSRTGNPYSSHVKAGKYAGTVYNFKRKSRIRNADVAIDIQNFALSDQSHLEGHVIRCSDDEGVYIVGCQMPEDNYAIRNYVDSLLGQ